MRLSARICVGMGPRRQEMQKIELGLLFDLAFAYGCSDESNQIQLIP